MKSNKLTFFIAAALLYCGFSCESIYFKEIENPYIRFVNQSDDTVWVEALLPDDITSDYEGSTADSIFYGQAYWNVNPHAMRQLWVNHNPGEVNYESFAARVFVMDSNSSINMKHARFDYYKKECGMDSLQVIQHLKEFEQNHLLHKHWYSKEELDNMNWTIVYPQKR